MTDESIPGPLRLVMRSHDDYTYWLWLGTIDVGWIVETTAGGVWNVYDGNGVYLDKRKAKETATTFLVRHVYTQVLGKARGDREWLNARRSKERS